MTSPKPERGLILYGPPAAGKSTIADQLVEALPNSVYHYRLRRSGEVTPTGGTYRPIEEVGADGSIIHEYTKFGNRYVIDRDGFDSDSTAIPIVQLGQAASVESLRSMSTAWTCIYIWCDRQTAAKRLAARPQANVAERLEAWDRTVPVAADRVIDTSETGTYQNPAQPVDELVQLLLVND